MRTIRTAALACLVVAATPVGALPTGVAPAAASSPGKDLPPLESVEMPVGVEGSNDLAAGAPAGPSPAASKATGDLQARLLRLDDGAEITVEVLGPAANAAVTELGAQPLAALDGLALTSLDATQIRSLLRDSRITQVRLPVDLRRGLLGVNAPRSDWQGDFPSQNWIEWQKGRAGAGVKVGIIDLFDPTVLDQQAADGEIPAVPAGQRACFWLGTSCPFGAPGYTHGNAVAEVMSEGAPAAALYLAEVGTLADYVLAIDWFAANGVTVVNHSATGPYDGPGDGTGPSAAVVDYAVGKGMAWFNAAGNAGKSPMLVKFAGGYFRGNWYDSNGNRWMNWYGTDESLSVYCGALMGVRWSDWGAARTDYDLYISDYRYSSKANGAKVLASAANQAGGAAPLEGNDMRWLCNTDPADGPVYDLDKDGFVSLWLYRTTRTTAPPTGDLIEVMVNHGFLEYPTSAGSAGIPFGDTRNPGAAEIGGIEDSGLVPYYSNRGPTNDGRSKPDFVALSCLDVSFESVVQQYCESRPFAGTSASTPVAAAIAAVGISEFGLTTPKFTIDWLRTTTPNSGNVKDNERGWGLPTLPHWLPEPSPAGYTPLTPTRVLDTRGSNGQAVGAPIGVRAPGSITTITLDSLFAFGNDMPADATVALNVAVVNATGPGFLQVFPSKHAAPGATSSINVDTGQTRANFVLVQSNYGSVSFLTSGGGHIIADLVGVFGSINHVRSPFVSATPYQLWDSQSCPSCSGLPLTGGTFVDLDVAGTSGTEPGASVPPMSADNPPRAVVLSVTVRGPTQRGYLSVVRPGTTTYSTSNLNFAAGEQLTTTTIMPVDGASAGRIRVFTSATAHVRIDVLGYFAHSNNGEEGWFTSARPRRVLDTRTTAKPAADSVVVAPVAGSEAGDYLSQFAGTVFVNTTSVHATGPGVVASGARAADDTFLTTSIPTATKPVAAGTLARLDGDGDLLAYTSVSSNIVLDVGGWFTGPDEPLPDATFVVHEGPWNIDGTQFDNFGVSDDGSVVAFSVDDKLEIFERATSSRRVLLASVNPHDVHVSGDGTEVFFVTNAQLVPEETSYDPDVYAYDLTTSTATLLTPGGSWSQTEIRGVSDDGDVILLMSDTPVDAADVNGLAEPYLLERSTGTGTRPEFVGALMLLSGDGNLVASVDPTGRNFSVWNAATGTSTTRLSVPTSWVERLEDMSDDGNLIQFVIDEQVNILDMTTGAVHELPIVHHYSYSQSQNVKASMDGTGSREVIIASILRFDEVLLDPLDAVVLTRDPFTVQKASRSRSGRPSDGTVWNVVLSDDGNWLLYTTSSTTITDTGQAFNIYLVDLSQL